MLKRPCCLAQVVLLILVTSFFGCQKSSDSPEKKALEQQTTQKVSQEGTPTTEQQPQSQQGLATSAPQAEQVEVAKPLDISTLPALFPRPNSDAKTILADMVKTYKNATSYADHGYVEMRYVSPTGKEERQRRECVFAYEKPNRVRMEVNDGLLVSDGTLLMAQAAGVSQLYGQVVEKRAPVEVTLKDLYSDYLLADLMDLGVPPEVLFFPPQIVLLFANDPLQTLVPEGAEVIMGLPEYILSGDGMEAYACDKIEVIDKTSGRRTYWVEWDTNTLMRMDIDVERIRESEVKPIAMKIELQDALINPEKISSNAFIMHKPVGSMTVREFLLPELTMLGKAPGGTVCIDASGQVVEIAPVAQKAVNVAVLFVTDPQAAEHCQASLLMLQRLSALFADNPDVNCYPISVDPANVSNEVIAETLKKWGISIPYLRQPQQDIMVRLGLQTVPMVLVFGPNGVLQLVDAGQLSPENLTQHVRSALGGNRPYEAILNVFANQRNLFNQVVDDWIRFDCFRKEPENVQIAERSKPNEFELSEVWRVTDFVSPGNPHVVGASLLIPHDFQKISVVGSDGKVLNLNENGDPATITPQGISEDMPLHFLRNAPAGGGQRYLLATGINQKRIFVFDKDLSPVLTWPNVGSANDFEIAAVQMADLNNDGTPEIVLGYRVLRENSQRLAVIDLSGKTLWEDNAVTEPDQVAVVLRDKTPYIWVINRYSETNALVEFDVAGKKLREWQIDPVGGLIWKIYAKDLDGDGNSEVLAVLPRDGGMVVAGINTDNRVGSDASQKPLLWEHAISPGSHGVKSFDFVVTGDLKGDSFDQWLVAAADGTISIFDKNGTLYDSFATGELLSGMAVLPETSGPILVLATAENSYDEAASQDAVIALQIKREGAASTPANETPGSETPNTETQSTENNSASPEAPKLPVPNAVGDVPSSASEASESETQSTESNAANSDAPGFVVPNIENVTAEPAAPSAENRMSGRPAPRPASGIPTLAAPKPGT